MRSKKKDDTEKFTVIFQVENCKVNYSLWSKDYGFDSPVSDSLYIDCKTIFSRYRSLKEGENVEFILTVEPYLMDERCEPTILGSFIRSDKKFSCYLSVSPSFPDRLDFILNRGIKPYFDLSCERQKHKKPVVKAFHMLSEVNLEDYL